MRIIIFLFACSFLFLSCRDCDCREDWSPNITYTSGDLANHNGTCWRAFAQGGGANVEPGTTGGDIWEACEE